MFITKRILIMLTSTLMIFSLSGCLKTRAQLKSDNNQDDATENASSADDSKLGPPAKQGNYEMQEVKNELTRISGRLEEVDHNQKTQNQAELKEYATRLDARIADLEKNQVLIMTELKAMKDKDADEKKAAVETSSDDLLTQGNQLLSQKHYEEASAKFRALLGKNIKGKEAADAHFGLGESEFGLKNYKKAIVQYSKVQESNAKSTHIPASLYRIGLSFQRLNMSKESKGFFSELIERYPKSPEAKRARAKVQE